MHPEGGRGTDSIIRNLCTGCRQVVSLTPRPLYPRKLLNRKLGGPHSSPERFWEQTNPLIPKRNRTSASSTNSLLTNYTTSQFPFLTNNSFPVKILCCYSRQWTVRGSNPGGGEIFRTCPDRPWGPPSLLYNGYRVFPGGKDWPGRDADPLPPFSAVVMKE